MRASKPARPELVGVSLWRWQNARGLQERLGGVVKLGQKVGMGKQQASHIFGARPNKGIGHNIARRMEHELGLPDGWMDKERDANQRGVDTLVLKSALIKSRESFVSATSSAENEVLMALASAGVMLPLQVVQVLVNCRREHGLNHDGLKELVTVLKEFLGVVPRTPQVKRLRPA